MRGEIHRSRQTEHEIMEFRHPIAERDKPCQGPYRPCGEREGIRAGGVTRQLVNLRPETGKADQEHKGIELRKQGFHAAQYAKNGLTTGEGWKTLGFGRTRC